MAAGDAPAGEQARFEHLIEALREPRRYEPADIPPGAAKLEMLETHISCVVLTAAHAYKLKKPLNLGFLDFSSLAARRFYCEEELRLNRRTAPDLYLAVVPIAGTPQDPRIGGKGPAIDYALKMRRFDQALLLDRMAKEGRLEGTCIDALGERIAAFHRELEPAGAGRAYASATQVLSAAVQNFDQIGTLARKGGSQSLLAPLREWTLHQHAALAAVFEARKRGGFVRECHGDLHLGNIVLLEGLPVPFDCIEFNAAFRWIDVMNEVAFLVMDLLEHRLPRLAWRFLNRYLELSGDYAGLRVLRFYVVYRALVRAKVACIRGAQPGASAQARSGARQDFVRYLELAREAAGGGRGALIVMHGLSGSGKTTVARYLAQVLPAVQVRSDIERKRLHGLEPQARTQSALDAGIYRKADTRLTYDRLAELAHHVLAAGHCVIVDASFLERRHRAYFRGLARGAGVPFAIVDCVADDAVLRERLASRQALGADASEAGLAVLERQLSRRKPFTAGEAPDVIEVDSEEGGAGALETLASVLAKRLARTAR